MMVFKCVTLGTPGAASSSTPRGTNRYSPHARARIPGRISGAVWARPGRSELARGCMSEVRGRVNEPQATLLNMPSATPYVPGRM